MGRKERDGEKEMFMKNQGPETEPNPFWTHLFCEQEPEPEPEPLLTWSSWTRTEPEPTIFRFKKNENFSTSVLHHSININSSCTPRRYSVSWFTLSIILIIRLNENFFKNKYIDSNIYNLNSCFIFLLYVYNIIE